MAEEQQFTGGDYSNDQQYEYSEGNFNEQFQEGGNGDNAATNGQYGDENQLNTTSDSLKEGGKKVSDDDRKLFIGGISWETEPKDLKDYFTKYGEVVDYNIKTDPTSGKCRGFGFLTFGTVEAVDAVLNSVPHTIKGKQIDPKRARARPGIKKIFVGGLEAELSEADIRTHFEKYGKIESIEQPFDKTRNQKRQFCFITFESEEMVEEACKLAKQKIGSKECDVKKASTRPESGRGGRGGFAQRGARGRGGRGGYAGNQGWGQNYYGQGGYGYGQGYGYGNYGNYDYTGYNGGYGGNYGNYDYSSGWNYGAQNYGYNQQPSNYGKTRRGAVSGGAYHPYGR